MGRSGSGTVRKEVARHEAEVHAQAPSKALSPLSDKEIAELILTHRENGRKLARSLLRRWRVVMPVEETDSIVDLTLCEAARRFSPEKGASFITFLFYHLRGHLVRAVANAASETSVFLTLLHTNGNERGELVESIDDGAMRLPDMMGSATRDVECPETILLRKERADLCRGACSKLDELEREVIDRSYVNDEALVDIAESLGYSRCHISRVKKRALSRLRYFIRIAGAEAEVKASADGARRVRRRRAKRGFEQEMKEAA